MVYIGFVLWMLLSAILCFGSRLNISVNKKLFLFLVFFAASIIMGVRGVNVGVDTYAYKEKFSIISNTGVLEICSHFYFSSLEVGYALFMKICSLIVDNYFFFQMVYAVTFAILSARFIYKNADNILVATVVFFGIEIYAIAFNVARQMLAVVIVANAWTYLRRGNKFKALFCLLIATTMHLTSIIFLCAFLLYALRNRKSVYKLSVVVLILLVVLFESILPLVTRFFPVYYNYYANQKGVQTAGFVWIIWLIVLSIAIWTLFAKKDTTSESSLTAVFTLAWFTCNVIGISFNYFERLGYYFVPFVPILFSQFERYLSGKMQKYIYNIGVCGGFLVYFLISVLGSNQYIYTTFFEL